MRVLRILLATIPLITFGGVALTHSFSNDSIGEIIASGITAGLSAAVYVAFWVTLIFALLERTGTSIRTRWNVDRLPEQKVNQVNVGNVISSLTILAALAVALLWDRLQGFVRLDGEPFMILNPNLWPLSISGLFILMAGRAAPSVRIFIVGRWITATAIVNTTLAILFMSLAATLLGRGSLMNPELISAATEYGASADLPRILALITGLAIVGFASWSIGVDWRRTADTTSRSVDHSDAS
ncbi:hypothetical protein [Cryobacterium aureum]|uniref:hypothetical protein n=1 Tax=Cryobacterium aureum TaxID=995037 RepID=UPI000CF4D5B0|nr:hypothetical protein [Cryobacterium aureum]